MLYNLNTSITSNTMNCYFEHRLVLLCIVLTSSPLERTWHNNSEKCCFVVALIPCSRGIEKLVVSQMNKKPVVELHPEPAESSQPRIIFSSHRLSILILPSCVRLGFLSGLSPFKFYYQISKWISCVPYSCRIVDYLKKLQIVRRILLPPSSG
jgi:hypothetical protein